MFWMHQLRAAITSLVFPVPVESRTFKLMIIEFGAIPLYSDENPEPAPLELLAFHAIMPATWVPCP